MVVPPRHPYQQVADFLRERIASGEYPPGKPLPGAFVLAREFGVALSTAQNALAALSAEGVTKPDERGRSVVQAWRSWKVTLGPDRVVRVVEAADQVQALARVLAEAGPDYAAARAEVTPADPDA